MAWRRGVWVLGIYAVLTVLIAFGLAGLLSSASPPEESAAPAADRAGAIRLPASAVASPRTTTSRPPAGRLATTAATAAAPADGTRSRGVAETDSTSRSATGTRPGRGDRVRTPSRPAPTPPATTPDEGRRPVPTTPSPEAPVTGASPTSPAGTTVRAVHAEAADGGQRLLFDLEVGSGGGEGTTRVLLPVAMTPPQGARALRFDIALDLDGAPTARIAVASAQPSSAAVTASPAPGGVSVVVPVDASGAHTPVAAASPPFATPPATIAVPVDRG